MRLSLDILRLPASILLLLAPYTTQAENTPEERSPIPLPKHVRYWPEDPPHRRRDLEALEAHIQHGDRLVGVMKMSPDPGEKFYPEYWQYEQSVGDSRSEEAESKLRSRSEEEDERLSVNVSAVMDLRAPFALHDEDGAQELKARAAIGRSAAALAALEKRQFTCPTGTSSCSSIGYPNSCCPAGESCFQIQDTGLGPVGCCPLGRSCSGTISFCAAPNLACPQSLGGGCCIPGFACQGVGCVINVITTIIVTPSAPSTSTAPVQTSIFTPPPPPPSPTTSSSTTVLSSTTLTCRSDSNPCPSSLGGGCCHTDRVCAPSGICAYPPGSSPTSTSPTATLSQTSIITGGIPIRPTSELPTGPIQTTNCPVYYYACSARYGGGCCQTGRDCQVTSCPPTQYTTIIDTDRTVVVPVGPAATVNVPTGVCASGWQTCAASLGGNCCPNGYECGTASCTLTSASNTAIAGKNSPASAGNLETQLRLASVMMGVSIVVLLLS